MTNILFTICGRAGSKGCKNKNIRNFLGKPLFEYSIKAVQEYNKSNNTNYPIAVSTDSKEFINMVETNHKDVFIVNRNENLAGDSIGKIDVIRDLTNRAEKYYQTKFDFVVDLDITSPIRTINDIKKAIELAQDSSNYDCVFSVVKSRRNPYFNMIKYENNKYSKVLESNFTSRQQAPQMYDMNASIYVYRREFLLSNETTSPIQGKNGIVEMFDTGIIDIDNSEDFELMEYMALYMKNHFDDYKCIFE